MIVNEMSRASGLLRRPGLRCELLCWRDRVAAFHVAPEPEAAAHTGAFRCLLRFTPAAS